MKMTCLLPPGATLTNVSIEGSCPSSCSSPCPAPPIEHLTVTTSEVDVWRDDVRNAPVVVSLPSHAAGVGGTSFTVSASGAEYIQMTVKVVPHGGGAAVMRAEASCPFVNHITATASCWFNVDDMAVTKGDYDIIADATGWGDCGGAPAPCTPPGTLRVDSVDIR